MAGWLFDRRVGEGAEASLHPVLRLRPFADDRRVYPSLGRAVEVAYLYHVMRAAEAENRSPAAGSTQMSSLG